MNKGGGFTVMVLGYEFAVLISYLLLPICNPLLLTANCTGKPQDPTFHPSSFP